MPFFSVFLRRAGRSRPILSAIFAAALLAACGGGGSTTALTSEQIAKAIASCANAYPALPAVSANNAAPAIVDSGPCAYSASTNAVASVHAVNVPYTSVTICAPGSTTNCQTIDHVMIDTGSTGLRVMASVLNAGLDAALTPVSPSGGGQLTECMQFADGYSWGSVRTADAWIGGPTAQTGPAGSAAGAGEYAPNLPIQVIGDSAGYSTPGACSTPPGNHFVSYVAQNTPASFGANGVLGVGFFRLDCGPLCTTNPNNTVYFRCAPGSSTCTNIASAIQVSSPVLAFSSGDTQGTILEMPAVPPLGTTNVQGTLVFGIGTGSSDNVLPANAAVYSVAGSTCATATGISCAGDFSATITASAPSGVTPATGAYGPQYSFLDSGSNGLYLPIPSTTLPTSGFWYAPGSSVSFSASLQGETGTTTNGPIASGTANSFVPAFSIANATSLFATGNTAFSDLGAPDASGPCSLCGLDLGLPFFFGKNVFVAIDGATVLDGGGTPHTGPFLAF